MMAQEVMGKSVAVMPDETDPQIYAPVDGKVTMVADI